jgi:hypothetical protein
LDGWQANCLLFLLSRPRDLRDLEDRPAIFLDIHNKGRIRTMQEMKDAAKDAASGMTAAAAHTIEKAKDIGRDAIDKGYEGARDYASKGLDYAGEVSDSLTDFAQRQPWVALAGAFVIGYVAAQALRKLSL